MIEINGRRDNARLQGFHQRDGFDAPSGSEGAADHRRVRADGQVTGVRSKHLLDPSCFRQVSHQRPGRMRVDAVHIVGAQPRIMQGRGRSSPFGIRGHHVIRIG